MGDMTMEKELALLPAKVTAVEVFTGEKLDTILAEIEKKATDFTADTSTVGGRKEIAAMAYKVARSKTTLDDLGKDLVTDWKEKAKKVDEARKKSRDFLDALKDKVRKPLTDWEAAEELRVQAEKEAAEYAVAWDDAHAMHHVYLMEQKVAAYEAEMARKEAEANAAREAKEKADREAAEEKARLAREEQIRIDAEAKAKAEAAEAVARAEREKIAAEERAKLEREQAEKKAKEAAEQAERDRLAAEAKAKADQEAAVKAAQEAERAKAEAERKAKEEAEAKAKAEAEKLAANKKHQGEINRAILSDLTKNGVDEKLAKEVITLIATGKIAHVKINY